MNNPISTPSTLAQGAQLCVAGIANTPYVNGRMAIMAKYGIFGASNANNAVSLLFSISC